MYDRAKLEVARGERKVQKVEFGIKDRHLLPLDTSDLKLSSPPTPEPFGMKPLSATSATDTAVDDLPRRRSSSFSEIRSTQSNPYAGWGLGSIQEMMTPPVTPRVVSPPSIMGKAHRQEVNANGHRRRYSTVQVNSGDPAGLVKDAPVDHKQGAAGGKDSGDMIR